MKIDDIVECVNSNFILDEQLSEAGITPLRMPRIGEQLRIDNLVNDFISFSEYNDCIERFWHKSKFKLLHEVN